MKEIKLTQGLVALVDDEDFERLNQFKWHAHKEGNTYYANGGYCRDGVRIRFKMHRLILNITDPKIEIDHKDRNGLNNQKENLRTCIHSQNTANVTSHKDSSSKFLGVSWDGDRNKWKAQICFQGRNKFIGRFSSEEEAALVYNKKATEFHGEFANLNQL